MTQPLASAQFQVSVGGGTGHAEHLGDVVDGDSFGFEVGKTVMSAPVSAMNTSATVLLNPGMQWSSPPGPEIF